MIIHHYYWWTFNPIPSVYHTNPPPIIRFYCPVHGVFTSPYGMRWGKMHEGIDIANETGTPVKAASDGTVNYAGVAGGYGNLIELLHPDHSRTRYGHLSRIIVSARTVVNAGDIIGFMGSTGRSTGPHLHFEIIKPDGNRINPVIKLPKCWN